MSASRVVQMKALFQRLVWRRRRPSLWLGAEVRFVLTVLGSGLVGFLISWLV